MPIGLSLCPTAYPESDPDVHVLQSSYSEGEYVVANCTASPSNPPPVLTWYINGIKVCITLASLLVPRFKLLQLKFSVRPVFVVYK